MCSLQFISSVKNVPRANASTYTKITNKTTNVPTESTKCQRKHNPLELLYKEKTTGKRMKTLTLCKKTQRLVDGCFFFFSEKLCSQIQTIHKVNTVVYHSAKCPVSQTKWRSDCLLVTCWHTNLGQNIKRSNEARLISRPV